jgi:hypothetical protein
MTGFKRGERLKAKMNISKNHTKMAKNKNTPIMDAWGAEKPILRLGVPPPCGGGTPPAPPCGAICPLLFMMLNPLFKQKAKQEVRNHEIRAFTH